MNATTVLVATLWFLTVQSVMPARAAEADAGSVASQSENPPSDALAIIVHRSNPTEELTMAELRRIFMLETQTWPNGRKITLVLRERGQPERAEAVRLICRLSERDYDRHVLYQTFKGSVGWGPRSILSASAMRRFVFNAPGAIGYVSADETDPTVKVLRINGLSPGDVRYPLRRRPAASGQQAHRRD